jgi:hypothetical protein
MKRQSAQVMRELELRFPDMQVVRHFEGGSVYSAEDGTRWYLIIDEGTMADFLLEEDEDLVGDLVKVLEFETLSERESYLLKRNWV